MVYSPFPGQKLSFHNLGRHRIQGYSCNVYYSEFFNFVGENIPRVVVSVVLHVVGKNPKLTYILSQDGSVESYFNYDFNEYETERIRQWIEMHNNVIWCNGLEKKKNVPLPQIY